MSAPATFPDIVPSETQSRGLDAKLLLAGCLAERGHPVVVGSRIEVHNRIHTLSRGPYLAKDVRRSSRRMVRVMDKLGFAIAAWDEEAFVFSDHSTCHNRQVDPENLNRIKAYFALGAINREIIETAPGYRGAPVSGTEQGRGPGAPRPAVKGDGQILEPESPSGPPECFPRVGRMTRIMAMDGR